MSDPQKLQQRILVVDDNLPMRKMVESMLVSLGYSKISLAINGQNGWETILEHDIDIVISDYIMPELDGLALLHRIRSSKDFFHLPFIMITGADTWGDFMNTVQAEVDSYLIKPITAHQLDEVLDLIYRQQRASTPYLKAIHAGKHCYIQQDMAQALKHFLLAQAIEPSQAKPYLHLGQICQEMGKTAEAKRFYKKCLDIESNYINAIIGLAEIYSGEKNYGQMITYINQAVKVAPNTLNLYLRLAEAHYRLGDIDKTRKTLKQAARIAKNNQSDVAMVVDAYVASGLLDEADYLFGKKMQDNDDETVIFWNRLGDEALKRGETDKGKFFYLAALKLRPQDEATNYGMAKLLDAQGEYDGALAYAGKVLRLHPDSGKARELVNSLREKMKRLPT